MRRSQEKKIKKWSRLKMQRKRKTKTKKYFSRETKTNLLINLNLQPKKKNLLWKDKRDKKKDKLN